MSDSQALPHWLRRLVKAPALLPAKTLLALKVGEGVEGAQDPAVEKHQVHSQDQGEDSQGQQPAASQALPRQLVRQP